MGMYCLNMMMIALELARENRVDEDVATKFFEHFLYIAEALNNMAGEGISLWDEEDQFFYDVLHMPDESHVPLKVRSLVGFIPLLAVETIEPDLLDALPEFKACLEWFLEHKPHLASQVSQRTGKEAPFVYDPRVMAFKGIDTVSLLTLSGRVLVPFRFGAYQQSRMDTIKGQADLLYRNGTFYLAVTLEMPEPTPDTPDSTLGVDLGIINLATDSEGESFSGEAVEKNRKRHHALRQRLQKRGTRNAKRHLKKLSGKEARFKRNTNHVISKRIVSKAKANGQGIAIEELRHIRKRTDRTVRHSQRSRHSSWSFGQLRSFLSYKAALAGVPLHLVDPRNTSRMCHVCGHCAKENRKSQASFVCQACGYTDNADRNAAINISVADVMRPIAAGRA